MVEAAGGDATLVSLQSTERARRQVAAHVRHDDRLPPAAARGRLRSGQRPQQLERGPLAMTRLETRGQHAGRQRVGEVKAARVARLLAAATWRAGG